MGTVRCADLRTPPTAVLDWTSLAVNEFQSLVVPFEAAFQAHRALWRLDGRPRTARRIQVLLGVLRATWRARGDAPSRSLTELAQRLGVADAEAAAMVVPTAGSPPSELPAAAPASPCGPRWHGAAHRAPSGSN